MRGTGCIAAVLVLVGAASSLWADSFREVPARHWSYEQCSSLASQGILSRDPATSFSGQPQLTRLEFAIAILEPLASIDEAVARLEDDASSRGLLSAAARALRLSPSLSEEEIARSAAGLLRLTDEFSSDLHSLKFDPSRASSALRALADADAVRAWRAEALAAPPGALAFTGPAGAPADSMRVPFARGTVALSLPSDHHLPDLLNYLARSVAADRRGDGDASGPADPAVGDPRLSRLRTAYEYDVSSALTLSLAYEGIARRGHGMETLDTVSLASVGIGYRLTPSTSVKLSYSLLEYSNRVLDTPPVRDRVAETAVSIEF